MHLKGRTLDAGDKSLKPGWSIREGQFIRHGASEISVKAIPLTLSWSTSAEENSSYSRFWNGKTVVIARINIDQAVKSYHQGTDFTVFARSFLSSFGTYYSSIVYISKWICWKTGELDFMNRLMVSI